MSRALFGLSAFCLLTVAFCCQPVSDSPKPPPGGPSPPPGGPTPPPGGPSPPPGGPSPPPGGPSPPPGGPSPPPGGPSPPPGEDKMYKITVTSVFDDQCAKKDDTSLLKELSAKFVTVDGQNLKAAGEYVTFAADGTATLKTDDKFDIKTLHGLIFKSSGSSKFTVDKFAIVNTADDADNAEIDVSACASKGAVDPDKLFDATLTCNTGKFFMLEKSTKKLVTPFAEEAAINGGTHPLTTAIKLCEDSPADQMYTITVSKVFDDQCMAKADVLFADKLEISFVILENNKLKVIEGSPGGGVNFNSGVAPYHAPADFKLADLYGVLIKLSGAVNKFAIEKIAIVNDDTTNKSTDKIDFAPTQCTGTSTVPPLSTLFDETITACRAVLFKKGDTTFTALDATTLTAITQNTLLSTAKITPCT